MTFPAESPDVWLYLVGLALILSVSSMLLRQWRRAAALERSLHELHGGVRQLLRNNPVGTCLSDDEFQPLWQSIRVLYEQRCRSLELLPVLSEISSAANGLSIDTPQPVERLFGALRRAIPCRFIAALIFDRERGRARIAAKDGLTDRRVEEHLLERVESILGRNAIPPIREGTTVASPLGSDGYLWMELERPSLSREEEVLVAAVAQQTAVTLRLHNEAKEQSARLAFERDILLGISHDLRAPGTTALYAVRDLLTN